MAAPAADAPLEFKSFSREERGEVIRLAQMGERHPDPAVAAAAHRWSTDERWNKRANRLPGWLLPSLGVIVTVLILIAGLPAVLLVGGVGVVALGLLGWISTSAARAVRAVYSTEHPMRESLL